MEGGGNAKFEQKVLLFCAVMISSPDEKIAKVMLYMQIIGLQNATLRKEKLNKIKQIS